MIGLHTLQDNFVDISGHEIDWYDEEDGWTEDRRKKIWYHNRLMLDQLGKVTCIYKKWLQKNEYPC